MATATAPIPSPADGLTDAEIIDALMTRLNSTDVVSALAHEGYRPDCCKNIL
jgi:hypothetical protein